MNSSQTRAQIYELCWRVYVFYWWVSLVPEWSRVSTEICVWWPWGWNPWLRRQTSQGSCLMTGWYRRGQWRRTREWGGLSAEDVESLHVEFAGTISVPQDEEEVEMSEIWRWLQNDRSSRDLGRLKQTERGQDDWWRISQWWNHDWECLGRISWLTSQAAPGWNRQQCQEVKIGVETIFATQRGLHWNRQRWCSHRSRQC